MLHNPHKFLILAVAKTSIKETRARDTAIGSRLVPLDGGIIGAPMARVGPPRPPKRSSAGTELPEKSLRKLQGSGGLKVPIADFPTEVSEISKRGRATLPIGKA